MAEFLSDISKDFHVGDILSVLTGRLVSQRHMKGVYELLNFMTGDKLYTHQLSRARAECAPSLRVQHPDLDKVEIPIDLLGAMVKPWLGEIVIRYGESRPVIALAPDNHTSISPVDEIYLQDYADKLSII